MTSNLFSEIFKYKPKVKSQLEDFCTEIFVYILRKLIISDKKLALQILALFGFNKIPENNLISMEIETRKHYKDSNEKPLFPDITIKYKNTTHIIEVKIYAKIGRRKIANNKEVDQFERYAEIPKIKLYSLSKNVLFSDKLKNKNKILWSQICEILENDKSEIVINFLTFLKEHGMEKNNPIGKDIFSALQEARNLWYLIWNSWPFEEFPDYEPKSDFTADYIGYIVKLRQTPVIWIGQTLEIHGCLVFELTCDSFIKKLRNKNIQIPNDEDEGGNIIFSKLDINKILKENSETKQRKIIGDWLKENFKKFV